MSAHLAQSEDERFIAEFFVDAGRGFFVEAGASHPTEGSRTWALEQVGWTGILIEPQPELAAFLVTARSAKVFAVACSSPDKDGGSLPLRVTRPLTSLGPGTAPSGARTQYMLMVPARTLDAILHEAEAPTPIDFLSVDIDGHELAALRGFDFARWRPWLVAIRHRADIFSTHRHLLHADYCLVRCTGATDWYAPDEMRSQVSLSQRWQARLKFYLAWPMRLLRNAVRRIRGR